MAPTDGASWYLVHTRPRQERVALDNIQHQGYGAFLPLLRGRKRRKGRLSSVVEPMFPRYLFARLNTTMDNWRPIRWTFVGVASLVRLDAESARVPADLVERLRQQADGGGIRNVLVPTPKPGDRVRIAAGESVILLLDLVSGHASVGINAKYIDGMWQCHQHTALDEITQLTLYQLAQRMPDSLRHE